VGGRTPTSETGRDSRVKKRVGSTRGRQERRQGHADRTRAESDETCEHREKQAATSRSATQGWRAAKQCWRKGAQKPLATGDRCQPRTGGGNGRAERRSQRKSGAETENRNEDPVSRGEKRLTQAAPHPEKDSAEASG